MSGSCIFSIFWPRISGNRRKSWVTQCYLDGLPHISEYNCKYYVGLNR
jgi:hypothetical protein